MENVDLVVRVPHALTMTGDGVGYASDVTIAVDRGRIVAVGATGEVDGSVRAERTLDRPRHLALPGLVDAHMHTGLGLLRGLAQDIRRWMMDGIAPLAGYLDAEASAAGSRLAIVEALRCGTTTIGDYGTDMGEVARFVVETGARGHLTALVREVPAGRYGPGELYPFDAGLGRRLVGEALDLHDRWDGAQDGRIRVLLGPQGPDFLGRDLLDEVRRHAIERNTFIHLHAAQGDRETEQIKRRYGQRPIPWLDEIGYLDERLIAVHLTDASDDEAGLVARRGAGMVLCSGSIAGIDGIVPPAAAFQRAGGRVALGTDQAPGTGVHDLFREMDLTALLNKVAAADPEVMPAWRALRMATIEGAQAIGLGDVVGSLKEGKRADIILVDLGHHRMVPTVLAPLRNLVPNLVYAASGDVVTDVIVDGRLIIEERRFTSVAEDAIAAEAQSHAERVLPDAEGVVRTTGGRNVADHDAGRL
jgi:5-methylthioadenosine/S-adenosylhomocysteine deaminase